MVSKLKVAHCIFTSLSLVCGIVYCIVVAKVFDFVQEKEGTLGYITPSSVWGIGFAYIVPSTIGLLAALVQKKIPYVFQSFAGFLAIAVLLYFFFWGSMMVRQYSGAHFCEVVNFECTCGTSALQLLTTWYTCDDINHLVRLGISSDAMFFGGGIVTFISCVLASVLARSVGARPQHGRTWGTSMAIVNINSAYTSSQTTTPYSPYIVQTPAYSQPDPYSVQTSSSAYSQPDPYSQTKTDPFSKPPSYTASAPYLPTV